MRLVEKYAEIGEKCIRKYPELTLLEKYPCSIAYLGSGKKKRSKNRTIFAECTKIPEKHKWMGEYDFQIVVYEKNCVDFMPEQMEILLWHELMHIDVTENEDGGASYGIKDHDVQEFRAILDMYGPDWQLPVDGQMTLEDLQ